MPPKLRFEDQVQPGGHDECWLWHGYVDRTNGYGRLGAQGLAHRLAWERANGPIPPDLTVDHICRVRVCVNPSHLRLLPNVENARMNGNWAKTHCKHGHEFTPESTYVTREGHRSCRVCSGKPPRKPAAFCYRGHAVVSGDDGCAECRRLDAWHAEQASLDERIVDLARSGWPDLRISRELGVGRVRVRRLRRERGIAPRPTGRPVGARRV